MSAAVGLAGLIVALVGAAAVIGQTFRVSHNTSAFNNLKDIASGWQEKATLQAQQIEDLTTQNQSQARQIADLQGRELVLRDMVTGRSAVDKIAADLAMLTSSVNTGGREVLAQIANVRGEVKTVHETLREVQEVIRHG